MIAVALLAAAFLPLLEIQGRFVAATEAIERASARTEQRQSADAYLETVNFLAQPSGEARIGAHVVAWQTRPAGEPRAVRGAEGIPSRFEVALFDVSVEVAPAPLATPSSDAVALRLSYVRRGLGWRARRDALDDI